MWVYQMSDMDDFIEEVLADLDVAPSTPRERKRTPKPRAAEVTESPDYEEEPESGLEIEPDDPEITKIERPFDPEKIKVRTTGILVEQLVLRIKHGEIDLSPEFQRSFVWKTERQSRLIESLLLRIPIPVFYVSADDKENWSVVDGVQRITTFGAYMNDKFRLNKLEALSVQIRRSTIQ